MFQEHGYRRPTPCGIGLVLLHLLLPLRLLLLVLVRFLAQGEVGLEELVVLILKHLTGGGIGGGLLHLVHVGGREAGKGCHNGQHVEVLLVDEFIQAQAQLLGSRINLVFVLRQGIKVVEGCVVHSVRGLEGKCFLAIPVGTDQDSGDAAGGVVLLLTGAGSGVCIIVEVRLLATHADKGQHEEQANRNPATKGVSLMQQGIVVKPVSMLVVFPT